MTINVDNSISNALLTLKNLNAQANPLLDSGQASSGSSSDSASALLISGGAASADPLTAAAAGVGRAASIADVAAAAGGAVANLLSQLQQTATAASDPTIDPSARLTLNVDYKALLGQIQTTVAQAGFDGSNLLDGSAQGAVKFAIGPDGSTASLSPENLSLGGPMLTVAQTSSLGTASAASQALSDIDASVSNLSAALDRLTSQADQVTAHGGLLAQVAGLSQTGAAGDLNAEGAKLQALQIQQQLADQGQSIANQTPQAILAMFR